MNDDYEDDLDKKLKAKRKAREYWQFVRYGLAPGEWDAIFASQGGVCKVCQKRKKRMDTDHDHKTGKVRGILCHRCNILLGHAKDDHAILKAASEYLLTNRSTTPPVAGV